MVGGRVSPRHPEMSSPPTGYRVSGNWLQGRMASRLVPDGPSQEPRSKGASVRFIFPNPEDNPYQLACSKRGVKEERIDWEENGKRRRRKKTRVFASPIA